VAKPPREPRQPRASKSPKTPKSPRAPKAASNPQRRPGQRPTPTDAAPPTEPAAPQVSAAERESASALVDAFAAEQPFPLDPFQREAAQHLAEGRSVLVAAPTGTGKALEASTPVLTPCGWKAIKDLCVGDEVIGSLGLPVRVLGVYPQGRRPAYRVTFTDGVSVVCDREHLWAVNTRSRRHDDLPWRLLTLGDILDEGLDDGDGKRHFIPLVMPVMFRQPASVESEQVSLSAARQQTGLTQRALAARLGVSQTVVAHREIGRIQPSAEYRQAVAVALAEAGPQPRLHPYLLGLLLGDGGFSTAVVRFTSADDEIIQAVRALLPSGATLQKVPQNRYDWYIGSSRRQTRNPVVSELLRLGLMGHRAADKFVPHAYKFAPLDERLALLQGLLDTDGSVGYRGDIEYTTVSPLLAEDVAFLVRSLGGRTRIRQKATGYRPAYRLSITLPEGFIPFALGRKAQRCEAHMRRVPPSRAIAAVAPAGDADMVCIAVDARDGLFVVDGFVVTHNTIVAECGIWLARRQGLRAIYTAPLKALSNQKFRDLRAYYGAELVGLMTGDIVENPTAPIVVMTTEIYRNMLLEGSRAARGTSPPAPPLKREGSGDGDAAYAVSARDFARQAALDEELSNVGCVIFDELHYLSDPERGPVWEEAIIHSPAHVTFVGLSATVSNADQLCQWISEVHGPTSLVFHVERAVPLEHWFYLDGALHLVQNAEGQRVERFPNIGGEAKAARDRNRPRAWVSGGNGENAHGPGAASGTQPGQPTEPAPVRREAPEPGEILTALRRVELLPCLYFLPGRRAVEVAAESAASHLLTSPEQRARLHAEVQAWVRALPAEDQRLDQVRRLANLLPRGLAFHHAGLLPGLKVMVETLFARGDLRAVFATDTLALGINMPARSVVLGSLSKFDGVSMRLLTPNEYQQLTGRAGRRGMDAKGAAVIPYSPWDAFEPAFALLTGELQPVISAFTLRYNTVLNLWNAGDQRRLRAAVAASLREFQRHGSVRHPPAERRTRGSHAQVGTREPGTWLSRHAQRGLEATIALLRRMGYIAPDDALTVRGRMLRALFHPAGMPLVELCVTGALDGLGPAELAEVVSWFTFDDDRSLRNQHLPSHRLQEVRRAVYHVLKTVRNAEYAQGLALSPGVSDDFHGVALNWWRGISLGGLLRQVDLAEGDLLVSLNQTIDLLQQVQGTVGQVVDSRDLWADSPGTKPNPRREALRERLAALRPALDAAWHGLLRGSVAQSRAIPALASPDLTAVPLPMAEDEDPAEARQDRVESDQRPARKAKRERN
jgi:ATP-dependent RNA helicase HelY